MIGSDIRHDGNLPWGHWMRTAASPSQGVVIVDEHGREWRSLRDALWCGRLGMSRDNARIMEENLELMLAILANKARAIVPFGEDVHGLFGGNSEFYRWYVYWLQATGLLQPSPGSSPFGARATAEGVSVVRMLMATRSPQLAAIPVGAEALKTFGSAGTADECDRERFDAAECGSGAYRFAIVRERRFGRDMVSLLHRDPDDPIPMARTIWTMTCLDAPSRDRLHSWMHDRLERWAAWGKIARDQGAHALTQHLLALIVLDEGMGRMSDGGDRPGVSLATPRQR